MDKMSAEHFAGTQAHHTNDIDPQYPSVCMLDEFAPRSRSFLSGPVAAWSSAGRRIPQARQGAPVLCSRQMSEFAKRIEDSAENSLVWERIGGSELSRLRHEFEIVLGELLNELDQETGETRERYEVSHTPGQNGDIILAYHLACLLSSAVRLSHSQTAVRIEVGCSARHTEFSCFLGEQSAGVTMRKKDNLFALCTNGDWHATSFGNAPLLVSIRHAIQSRGGQVRVDVTDGITVKVSFPLSL